MRNLLILLLATSALLCCGCSSLPTGAQLETWKANTDKALAAAAVLADKATQLSHAAIAKADELKAAQVKQLEEVEAVAGALDSNGDGDVTLAEAKATISELRKTPEGVGLLTHWETYAAILASVAGLGVAKKGGAVALKAVHKKGRKLVNASTGVPS